MIQSNDVKSLIAGMLIGKFFSRSAKYFDASHPGLFGGKEARFNTLGDGSQLLHNSQKVTAAATDIEKSFARWQGQVAERSRFAGYSDDTLIIDFRAVMRIIWIITGAVKRHQICRAWLRIEKSMAAVITLPNMPRVPVRRTTRGPATKVIRYDAGVTHCALF
jgi:hypothetical protein